MISDDKKEEVRAAADIVEVVSDYVKLKKSGSGFVGLCPYHDEKTPSFNVTPRLGIFKCFGCGESGDVFKFVMDQEGVGFTEAVRQLAERYGVFIPEEENEEPSETTQLREGIYHALKFAGVFFYRNLVENSEAEKARKYLEKRGYNREVYKKFGLGYAPDHGEALYKAAKNAGIDDEYLLEANLIKESKRGQGYYDTFRGRLMFPIFNPTGKVIAFAGRVLGNEKTAKYINSAQTKVYNKSEVVYGGYYEGVNVEVSDWSMGLCAERIAIAKAKADGHSKFESMDVHTLKGEFSSPCGACRQVVTEMMPYHELRLFHADGSLSEHLSADLLPFSFKSSSLKK